MKFIIEEEIFEKLDNLFVGVVVVKDFDNSREYPKIQKLLQDSIKQADSKFLIVKLFLVLLIETIHFLSGSSIVFLKKHANVIIKINMENKNQQSKEFMRAFAKEMQTQEIDLGSDKAKDHKKRKIIILLAAVIVVIIATIITIVSISNSSHQAQLSSNNISTTGGSDNSQAENSNNEDDSSKEISVDEESQLNHQYWEIYDMVAEAGNFQAEEKIIDDYFSQKASLLNAADIDSNVLLISEKALVLSYHGNQERAKETIQLAVSNMGGASSDVKSYICNSIDMIASEAEDSNLLDKYKNICSEVENAKTN